MEWSTLKDIGWLTGASLLMMGVVSAGAIGFLIQLPADYFSPDRRPAPPTGSIALHWLIRILKNILGMAIIVVGALMALPGIPGPGLLAIFVGLLLVDFPGKFRLEQKLVAMPHVHQAIDRIRLKFGRPPLVRGASEKPEISAP